MTKEYRIRVLNAGAEFDGFSIDSSAVNGALMINEEITEKTKSFEVELGINFVFEYYDEERCIEIDADFGQRDYEDGSYPTFEDNVMFNIECEASGTIGVLLDFNEDGYSSEYIVNSFEISELQYSTDVIASERQHWDDYNDDELIDRSDLEHKLLSDGTVISFIMSLINDSQFELEEIEE